MSIIKTKAFYFRRKETVEEKDYIREEVKKGMKDFGEENITKLTPSLDVECLNYGNSFGTIANFQSSIFQGRAPSGKKY